MSGGAAFALRNPDNPTGRMVGWITVLAPDDLDLLKALGVEKLEPVSFDEYSCEMPFAVFEKLMPLWGQFYWHLEQR